MDETAAARPRMRTRFAIRPRWRRIVAVALTLAALLLLLLACLPLALFRGAAEARLSALLDRRVTIGGAERLDPVSFAPRYRLRDVRVAQPRWAGAGDMIVLREAVVRLPTLPLLAGRLHPSLLRIKGARVALVRRADGRRNWALDPGKPDPVDAGRSLSAVLVEDVRFTLDDAHRALNLAGTVASDGTGVRLAASGTHRGAPATIGLAGGPVLGGTAGKPWPFRARFRSRQATLAIDAAAARPLDFARFAGSGRASGASLRAIDDVIRVGLIETRPVRLAGRVVHDGDRWAFPDLAGTIGRSRFAGRLTVDTAGPRTRLGGEVRAATLDFDDLTSAAQRARAAARHAVTGDRVITDARIDLSHLRRLDGRVVLRVARLLSARPSLLRALDTTLTLDHATLVAAPLDAALAHGNLVGRITIDHPRGRRLPLMRADLRLVGGRIEDVITNGNATGPLGARIRLTGAGPTVRAAMAHADGEIALAARGGAVSAKGAEMVGRNLGSALGLLIAGSDRRTPLRCLAVRLAGRGGLLRPTLFTIDTGVTRADGRGTLNLDGETLALVLDGRSKHPGFVRLTAPVTIGGTLSHPVVGTGPSLSSPKTILKTIGAAFGRLVGTGREAAPAADVDCGALIAKAGM